jgi:outer membrane protein, heavy metal efflux system
MFRPVFLAATAACLCLPAPTRAQTILTLAETVARARERAGPVLVAQARIAEAEADLVTATARFRENPIIEANVGPRTGPDLRSTEVDVGFTQLFETGGQRRARIAGAQASINRFRADLDEARRLAIFDAVIAFVDGVAAGDRLRIAEEGDTLNRELLNATERRYALGDIAAIDVNLARIEVARSAATLRGARADFTAAVGRLRVALQLPIDEPIEIQGSLDLPAPRSIDELRGAIDGRPDFVALRAEIGEAEALIQLGRGLRRPDLGLQVAYEHEAPDNIFLGGLTIAIPAFQRGQGTLAAGVARAARARLQLETARQSAVAQLVAAYSVYQQHATLAGTLETEAMPSLGDNQGLAQRSYEAGELNLMELLLIRRNGLEMRTMLVERRLAAAQSRLEVDYVAGVLR